jgi:hypothetical protein
MTDNTPFVASTDPAAPKIADDEVSYNGDLAKVQMIQLVTVGGVEGAHTGPTKLADFSATLTSLLNKFAGTVILGKFIRAETFLTATVAIGANLSNAIDVAGYSIVAIHVPSTFDGTQINFQVSYDGTNFLPLRDATNTLVTMTVTAGAAHAPWAELQGHRAIKINTVTAQATTATDFVVQVQS